MQDAEDNRHFGHKRQGYKGYAQCGAEYLCASQKVVVAEGAGNTADKNECCSKNKAYGLKKIKEYNSKGFAEHISVGEEAMKKHHAKYAEAADFIYSVDSSFVGQDITDFKKYY